MNFFQRIAYENALAKMIKDKNLWIRSGSA